jgi:SAM-dependent methyltransferase
MADPAVARHFGDKAAGYSRLRATGLLGRVRAAEQRAVQELAGVSADDLVLDAGCGDGATLEWLRVPGARAVGVDLVWSMARVCSQKGFDVAVQDIEELGLRPVFTWVLCIGALEFVRDPARALANLADCLAPSGALLLLYPRRGPLGTLYSAYHRTHGARIHLFSRREMSALLVGAGFETPAHQRDCLLSTVCSTRLARGASR